MSNIKLINLTKHYKDEIAINNINLTLDKGKIIGLLGPNGSGKTTIIKLINDLIIPTSGEVLINDLKPGKESKKIISYMPDKLNILSSFTPKKAIYWYSVFFEDFNKEKAYELLEKFEIKDDKKISKLSKGTIEKLQLALTLSRKADIYILDEPLAGVDPAARDKILDLILLNFNPNSLMLISTHLIADVEKILDEIIFIKKGEIILSDNADKLRQEKNKSVDELFREMFK